jgi:hypothetical protein
MAIPLIASALPSIASFLAKKGLNLLSSVFKGSVNKGMETVANAIQEKTGIDINDAAEEKLTDEQVIKLKEFELQHEEMVLAHTEKMSELELEEAKIHQKDRESARGMQIEAQRSDDKFVRRFLHIYASTITILTFGYIFMVTIKGVNPGNQRIVDTVIGFLLGVTLSAIIQFFFGSSKGSSDKQGELSILTRQLADIAQGRK